MSDDFLSDKALKRLLGIVILYQIAGLFIVAISTFITFGKDDWIILWVPQSVLEWSLIGAIGGVLSRLSSYPHLSKDEKAELFLWSIVKPFLGTAWGGVIYFLASAGVLVLKGNAAIDNIQFLCAIAFIAAFSDKFSRLYRIAYANVRGELFQGDSGG